MTKEFVRWNILEYVNEVLLGKSVLCPMNSKSLIGGRCSCKRLRFPKRRDTKITVISCFLDFWMSAFNKKRKEKNERESLVGGKYNMHQKWIPWFEEGYFNSITFKLPQVIFAVHVNYKGSATIFLLGYEKRVQKW